MQIPLNINLQQILLHLLNFVILFGVLYYFLYSPVQKFMAEREKGYKDMDEAAKAHLKAAEDKEAAYAAKLRDAANETAAAREKATREMNALCDAKIKEAEQAAEKILTDAAAKNEAAYAKMVRDAQNEIADLVTASAEKLATTATTADAYDLFLNDLKGREARE